MSDLQIYKGLIKKGPTLDCLPYTAMSHTISIFTDALCSSFHPSTWQSCKYWRGLQIVFTLEVYGVKDILGIQYGFKGFVDKSYPPVKVCSMASIKVEL